MSPQLGMLEILLLAGLALIVLGPVDLAVTLRRFGRWTRKIRAMANEFGSQIEEFGQEMELEKLTEPTKKDKPAKTGDDEKDGSHP